MVKSFSGIDRSVVCFVLYLQAKISNLTLPTRTSPTSTVAQKTLSPNLTMAVPTTTGLLNSQSSHGKCVQSEDHSIHRSRMGQATLS
jgi:hypothetical protein